MNEVDLNEQISAYFCLMLMAPAATTADEDEHDS